MVLSHTAYWWRRVTPAPYIAVWMLIRAGYYRRVNVHCYCWFYVGHCHWQHVVCYKALVATGCRHHNVCLVIPYTYWLRHCQYYQHARPPRQALVSRPLFAYRLLRLFYGATHCRSSIMAVWLLRVGDDMIVALSLFSYYYGDTATAIGSILRRRYEITRGSPPCRWLSRYEAMARR